METTTNPEANMASELTLIDREKSNNRTQWIVGRSGFFVSNHDDGIELWKSNRPYRANDRLHKFPAGHSPTMEDIDNVLHGMGL